MDAAATPGFWKKNLWHALAVAALCACSYSWPEAAMPLALLLALIVCPALNDGHLWFALGLPLAAMLAYLLGGGSPLYAALLPLAPYLSLLAVSHRFHRQLSLGGQALACAAAFVAAALAMLASLSASLGGPLFPSLTNAAVTWLQGSVRSGNVLYRLVSLGFLTLPDSYRNAAALQLGDWIWLNPILERELINMLRLRLSEGLSLWVPMALMQGAVIVGMFSALRAERARVAHAEEHTVMPQFRALHLPRSLQGAMLVLCIGTVLTSLSELPLASLMCVLMYATFAAVYQLLGAAVMVFIAAKRHRARAWLYGVLAALLFVIFPVALFVLGMADQFLNIRSVNLNHQEEE